jgi:hypothetical protein
VDPRWRPRSLPTNGPLEVWLAESCTQRLRAAYRHHDLVEGKKIADSCPTCPVPEIARPGQTLRKWRAAFFPDSTAHHARVPQPSQLPTTINAW